MELKDGFTVTCHNCRNERKKHGRDRKANQRFRCQQCAKTFLEAREKPLEGRNLRLEKAEAVLRILLEGNSIASTSRVLDINPGTITRLLILAGEKCEQIIGKKVVNVPVRDVEMDEAWSFIGCKQKCAEGDPNRGDCYVFVAIERNSKIVLDIAMGKRDKKTTEIFLEGVRQAKKHGHFQVTLDGFAPYRSAVSNTLEDRCDFAQLIKAYKAPSDCEARYSPAEVASVEVVPVMGRPDPEGICTSIVERSNLSLRMGARRFTRLTNAFSKKCENQWAATIL